MYAFGGSSRLENTLIKTITETLHSGGSWGIWRGNLILAPSTSTSESDSLYVLHTPVVFGELMQPNRGNQV